MVLDFFCIRHGQTANNKEHTLVGGQSLELPLTHEGKRQACALGMLLNRCRIVFDEIHSSTAQRAIDTAQIACMTDNGPNSCVPIKQHSELLEINQGDWEGAVREEVYTEEVYKQIMADSYNFKAPNGESQKELGERIHGWMQNKADELWGKGENKKIGVFFHGFAIKAWLRKILDFDPTLLYHFPIHNCSITRVLYGYHGEKRWHTRCINYSIDAITQDVTNG